ncbi:MAG TPA: MFS transporter [Thermoplasmata archaeon]|nr:MFS transporter [Thermoplasmata archaeon]
MGGSAVEDRGPRAAPSPGRISYKWVALSNTTIGTLMSSLDSNIVIIALPTIGRELPGTSILGLLWILLGYSLVTSVVLLSFGRLSDQFGRTRLYTLGFAVFTVGSLFCGLSQNGPELIGFRMVQAIGAGFIFSNSAAILTDAFPANERGKALGINQISIVVGSVSGLVIGGLLTGAVGWRWIFFVNVPIGILATLWAHFRLRELASLDPVQRIDWAGNVTFASGLTLILVGVTFGALQVLAAPVDVGLGVTGIGLLGVFAYVESRIPHPMFELALFRIRAFSSSGIAMFLNALARGAFSFVLVFYLQGPPHFLDPLTAGLFLIPVSASLAALGPLSGALSDRWGSRGLAVLGLLASSAGFLLLSEVSAAASFWSLLPAFLLVGSGMGLFASPNRATMMNAVPPQRRGVAAGTGTTLVNAGVTLSLGFAVLAMSRAMSLPGLEGIFLGTGGLSSLPVGPFLNSVHLVFALSAGLLLVAVVPAALRPSKDRA